MVLVCVKVMRTQPGFLVMAEAGGSWQGFMGLGPCWPLGQEHGASWLVAFAWARWDPAHSGY